MAYRKKKRFHSTWLRHIITSVFLQWNPISSQTSPFTDITNTIKFHKFYLSFQIAVLFVHPVIIFYCGKNIFPCLKVTCVQAILWHPANRLSLFLLISGCLLPTLLLSIGFHNFSFDPVLNDACISDCINYTIMFKFEFLFEYKYNS